MALARNNVVVHWQFVQENAPNHLSYLDLFENVYLKIRIPLKGLQPGIFFVKKATIQEIAFRKNGASLYR